MTRKRMAALRYSNDDIKAVSELVALHLRFHTYAMGWSDSAVRRYVRDAGPLLQELNVLTRCDCTTRNAKKAARLARRMDELEVRIDELDPPGIKVLHIQELDWNGDVLWDFRWDTEEGLNHHDIEEMPNGNILMIAWDRTTRDVALAAGRDPELLEGNEWWGGAVYEIRPTRPKGGEVVWSWRAMDHLIQTHDSKLPNYGDPREHPERIDINGDRDPDPPDEEEQKKIDEQMAAIGYAGGDDEEPPSATRMPAERLTWCSVNSPLMGLTSSGSQTSRTSRHGLASCT